MNATLALMARETKAKQDLVRADELDVEAFRLRQEAERELGRVASGFQALTHTFRRGTVVRFKDIRYRYRRSDYLDDRGEQVITWHFGVIDGVCNAGKYYVKDSRGYRHIVFKEWCTRAYL